MVKFDPNNIPEPYEVGDFSPFNPSQAIYFMDGYSAADVRITASGETLSFEWYDENTTIAARAPFVYDEEAAKRGLYTVVPKPLRPLGLLPTHLPKGYDRKTTSHLLQVVSMNMTSRDGKSRLLIGYPYAEKYAGLFFSDVVSGNADRGAASYGIVQSLTEFTDPETGGVHVDTNGYPAKSVFAVYHILETTVGAFFNKKPTVMELQPDKAGKLALSLPPIPFEYNLVNGPIPLYDVNDPHSKPVAEVLAAHHNAQAAAVKESEEAWPFHQMDLAKVENDIQTWRATFQ